jgi:hypothetical protein
VTASEAAAREAWPELWARLDHDLVMLKLKDTPQQPCPGCAREAMLAPPVTQERNDAEMFERYEDTAGSGRPAPRTANGDSAPVLARTRSAETRWGIRHLRTAYFIRRGGRLAFNVALSRPRTDR